MESESKDQAAGNPNHLPLVLLLTYPAQGLINPMIQFAKRLASHKIQVIHVTTPYIHKSMLAASTATAGDQESGKLSIPIELISDGFDDSGLDQCGGDMQKWLDSFKTVGSHTLTKLIQRLAGEGRQVTWLIYNSFFPWVQEVANKFGIRGASFFTQPAAVSLIYYLCYVNKLEVPSSLEDVVNVPGLPPVFKVQDLPGHLSKPGSYPANRAMLINQYVIAQEADYMFINTCKEVEADLLDHHAYSMINLIPVGPTLPSAYLDPIRFPTDLKYEVDLWKPAAAEALMAWLGSKQAKSVIYASFGSMGMVKGEQVVEVEAALEATGKNYILVKRSSAAVVAKPSGSRGLVVGWSPQLAVLAHEAIGCFVSHCGWNSTLESLSLGVPMVCMPIWADQPTNAFLVEEVWGVGLRPKVAADLENIIGREEIKRCIMEIMEDGGEMNMQIWSNVEKWKSEIRKAVSEGGSTDKNVMEFINKVLDDHHQRQ